MKLSQLELGSIALLVGYVAFFTRPPPAFVSSVLSHPVGQVLALLGVVYVASQKSMAVGLFLAIAYLTSSYPTLEYLDPKEQAPQPKSGAPPPDIKSIGKLADMLKGMGKGGKLPTEQGKDVKKAPVAPVAPKPHEDPKVTEKFSLF